MRKLLMGLAMVVGVAPAWGQWVLQESHTTASLRGIHSLGGGVAWASGSGGTVLRTLDGGKNWQRCAVPPGGETLDFRGVQGFDAKTAIVMSSGKGDLSRLYKTVDGCGSWKLVATNPKKEGFWDAIVADGPIHARVLGDSVAKVFQLCDWNEGEDIECGGEPSEADEGSFAASNSVLQIVTTPQIDKIWKYEMRWVSETPKFIIFHVRRYENTPTCEPCQGDLLTIKLPITSGSASAGIFSFNFRDDLAGVAVGGDYMKPAAVQYTAIRTSDGGLSWQPSVTNPGGYRSAVAFSPATSAWIAVGPNGTDISVDDGKNWRALRPAADEAVGADAGWNALSLPFVVGSKGRIGVLRDGVLK